MEENDGDGRWKTRVVRNNLTCNRQKVRNEGVDKQVYMNLKPYISHESNLANNSLLGSEKLQWNEKDQIRRL